MNKDPKNVSQLRVYAETIGEMFNGFVDELSFRSVVRSVTSTLGFQMADKTGLFTLST